MVKRFNKKLIFLLIVVAAVTMSFNMAFSAQNDTLAKYMKSLKKQYQPPEALVPSGTTVESKYVAGVGTPVGKAQMVQGKVFVIHQNQTTAYRIKKGNPVYTGDTLITNKRARINVLLNDNSMFSLAPVSKLSVDKSVYEPKWKVRKSKLSMLWGKARFIVKKIKGKSDYNVKTPTAVCGVRGTDFVVAVTPEGKKTSALDDFINFFASLGFVENAHAAAYEVLMTVMTGEGSTIEVMATITTATDAAGVTSFTVGPLSAVSVGATGAGIITPVAASAATSLLNAVGPQLVAIDMPPGID